MNTKPFYAIAVLLVASSHCTHAWFGYSSPATPPRTEASPTPASGESSWSAWGWSTVTSGASAVKNKVGSMLPEGTPSTSDVWQSAVAVKNKVGSMLPEGTPSTSDVWQGAVAVKNKVGSMLPEGIPSTNDVWLAAAGLKDKGLSMLPAGMLTLPVVTESVWQTMTTKGKEAHAAVMDAASTVVQNAEKKRAEAIVNVYKNVGSASSMIWKYYADFQKIASDNIDLGVKMGIQNMENAKTYLQDNQEALKSILKGIVENKNVEAAIGALNIRDPNALIRDPKFLDMLLSFVPPPIAAALKLTNSDVAETLKTSGVSTDLLRKVIASQVPQANAKTAGEGHGDGTGIAHAAHVLAAIAGRPGFVKAAGALALAGLAFMPGETKKGETEKGKE